MFDLLYKKRSFVCKSLFSPLRYTLNLSHCLNQRVSDSLNVICEHLGRESIVVGIRLGYLVFLLVPLGSSSSGRPKKSRNQNRVYIFELRYDLVKFLILIIESK